MFSGIVRAVGTVAASDGTGGGRRLSFEVNPDFPSPLTVGASVAVNGVCLTVVKCDDRAGASSFAVDVSAETLLCTTLGELGAGDRVNLEPALRLSDALDGHFVTGHVDGVGTVVADAPDGSSRRLEIEAPAALARFIAQKGSVCVDGISLTVNRVNGSSFEVNLIPHTLAVTTFSQRRAGDRVNIEVDLLARYLARIAHLDESSISSSSGRAPG